MIKCRDAIASKKKYVGVILYCYNIDIGFTEELTLRNAPAAMQQAGQAGVSLDNACEYFL